MRPVRLELEGFTVFRDHTVVDFDGVELFALCGPTGAGKTSVIDGLTFALYGSVPRLDDERLVAPVLSQGRVEARVRLDFTVGSVPYTAVRVVRATSAGRATTKEARLERGDGELLAGDADAVTAAVSELLGLDFRQFTTCVSLPQGEFARFLHDKPGKRQDLLVRLLDLGLYDRVAALARQRAAVATDRVSLAQARLEQLAGATEEAVAAAAARVGDLGALRERIDAMQPELDALAAAIEVAERDARALDDAVALLAAVTVPAGVADLASSLAAASAAYDTARTADVEAAEALTKADAALDALPARATIESTLQGHEQHEHVAHLVVKGEVATGEAIRAAEAAAVGLDEAERAHAEAVSAFDAARTAELAHVLAAELVVGEPCPVCEQPVAALHRRAAPKVQAAERAVKQAEKALAAARKKAGDATTERARVEEKLASARAQLAEVALRIEGAPPPEALRLHLAEVDRVAAVVDAAKRVSTAARASREDAERAVEAARRDEAAARGVFDRARDTVAALQPPAPTRADLVADWQQLDAWASARRPEIEADATARRAAAARDRSMLDERRAVSDAECRALGVEPGDRPRDAVVDALGRADGEHRRLQDELAEARELRAKVDASSKEAAVAQTLASHLVANKFEQWLLDAVLQQLVDGATNLLLELSGGAYSLVLDAKSRAFAVIDHVNADAVRPARTLSGGETFLASLALALALSDQVALVAGSAARLETILLDEGFGTLDADTLEVVATALEELGARGRMVGVVTHVRELAERLPVRYEIRKVGGAASIERVGV